MIEKHAKGQIPSGKPLEPSPSWLKNAVDGVNAFLEAIAPDEALKNLWELIRRANQLVEEKAPWTLAKEGRRQELEGFLYELAETIRVIAILLWPFMPGAAESIWQQLGFDSVLGDQQIPGIFEKPIPAGQKIRKGKPLFPKVE